jgi:hypothetical protein
VRTAINLHRFKNIILRLRAMSEHRLSEIVIERPRWGMRRSSRRLKGVKQTLNRLTEIASEDGLLCPYLIKTRDKTKFSTDHLGPLRQLLHSKVNQPWDSVYSDLCQRLNTNTLMGQHVLSHLWGYVERYVEIRDGVPYAKAASYGSRPLGGRWRNEFYIHPDTGILLLAERSPKPLPQAREDVIAINAYSQYRKLNEIWYLITFTDIPKYARVWDVVLRIDITLEIAYREYGQRIYASCKTQCGKQLLKVVQSRLVNQ